MTEMTVTVVLTDLLNIDSIINLKDSAVDIIGDYEMIGLIFRDTPVIYA
ncbi:hypothetical protein ABID23_000823 [Bartonella silvatica]|uniref:Phage related protein n=1 Tax=Bartonella silvatica TaxID=357760 RepID=A0ABV2HGQ9_9HYPH